MAGKDEGWGGSSNLLQGARNPAAPAGLRQTMQRQASEQQAYDSGRSILRPWQPEYSQLKSAKSWYTGANNEGTQNGWSTPFYQKMFQQQDAWQQKSAAAGKPSMYYGWLDPNQNSDATGVQTWGADP